MEQELRNILAAISDPAIPVSEADVSVLAEKYPFFTLPAVMLMRRDDGSLSSEARERLLERVVLNAQDPQALAILSDPSLDEWTDFYPASVREVTTDNVITRFLETYGHSSPKEDALLERLIFNPIPDYSSLLAREEETSLPEKVDPSDTSEDAIVNAYILSRKGAEQPDAPETEPDAVAPIQFVEHPQSAPAEDNTSLTESLAKIYIRQKRFDKAFEIIHTLSLNNPKKSAYFADQLRFLRKLMLVQQLKSQ